MKELPILFTRENRLAVIEGRKTQTRRIVKLPETIGEGYSPAKWSLAKKPQSYGVNEFAFIDEAHPTDSYPWLVKARYEVGDHLWMQEPYQLLFWSVKFGCQKLTATYQDDNVVETAELTNAEWDKWDKRKYPHRITSARFMYKSLARHWRKVTGVRVERLQDISYADVKKEGIGILVSSLALVCYMDIWDSINSARGYGFDSNPYVFVYTLEELKGR